MDEDGEDIYHISMTSNDFMASLSNWLSVWLNTPFVIFAALAAFNEIQGNTVYAARVFTALTGIWIVTLYLIFTAAIISSKMTWLPIIPHIAFTLYYVVSVTAFELHNPLLSKLSMGLFGLTLICTIVICFISFSRYKKAEKLNQELKDMLRRIEKLKEKPTTQEEDVLMLAHLVGMWKIMKRP